MRFKTKNYFYSHLLNKINFRFFKNIFFISNLIYFCFYFANNLDEITFKLNFEESSKNIFFSFIFCAFSIFLNAFAWKYIIRWFGEKDTKNKLVSFYVLTNILKYVPGGIWHFFERYNFIKNKSNSQLAFYSTLIEPYFMLCAALLMASVGIVFSPFYLLLIIPCLFLNKKLIYYVLKRLESLKGIASEKLKLKYSKSNYERKINLSSFFPTKAFLFEIGFVFSKFLGFFICFNMFNLGDKSDFLFLFLIFCLSWSIGLIIPAAPSGVGVFEACFLFFVGKNIPQNIVFVSLIYFRVISTLSDLVLSLPFLFKKLLKNI